MDWAPFLPILSIATILSAGLTILGHYLQPPRPWLIYIFKPLTTILILAMVVLHGDLLSNPYTGLIALGLFFSLAGDIFLVLPSDKFVQGLGSFLLAHLVYGSAFKAGAQDAAFPWVLVVLLAAGSAVLAYLWRGLSRGLIKPVTLYLIIIMTMAALAVGRALGSPSTGPILAGAGALLFVASDATLAISRFRRPFHLAQAAVLVSYFAAQWLIASSVG